MKLVNISENLIYIVYVKDEEGNDRIVKMHPNDHVFTPTNEKTKSVTLQGMKKNIAVIFDEPKPEHIEYFVPYKEQQLILEKTEIKTNVEIVDLIIETLEIEDIITPNEEIKVVEVIPEVSHISAINEYYKGINIDVIQEKPAESIDDLKTKSIQMFINGATLKKITNTTGAPRILVKEWLTKYIKESGKKLTIK